MTTPPAPSDRTQVGEVRLAYKIVLYFAALVLGGLSWIVLNKPFQMLMSQADTHTSSQAAAEGQLYMTQIWEALPLVFAVLFAFGLILASQQEAEGP